jgi:hypothetical protein
MSSSPSQNSFRVFPMFISSPVVDWLIVNSKSLPSPERVRACSNGLRVCMRFYVPERSFMRLCTCLDHKLDTPTVQYPKKSLCIANCLIGWLLFRPHPSFTHASYKAKSLGNWWIDCPNLLFLGSIPEEEYLLCRLIDWLIDYCSDHTRASPTRPTKQRAWGTDGLIALIYCFSVQYRYQKKSLCFADWLTDWLITVQTAPELHPRVLQGEEPGRGEPGGAAAAPPRPPEGEEGGARQSCQVTLLSFRDTLKTV